VLEKSDPQENRAAFLFSKLIVLNYRHIIMKFTPSAFVVTLTVLFLGNCQNALAKRHKKGTKAPTISASPTHPITFQWGLEQLNTGAINVTSTDGATWPAGYPQDPKTIVTGNEYYIPASVPNVTIDFDLGKIYKVQGVYVHTWFYTSMTSIEVALRSNKKNNWTWFTMDLTGCCFNTVFTTIIPKFRARYVQFRVTGGYSTSGGNWGFRIIKIGGVGTPCSHGCTSKQLMISSPFCDHVSKLRKKLFS
jgi:hypothetical protein